MTEQEMIDEILAYILGRFESGNTKVELLDKELLHNFPKWNWSDPNTAKGKCSNTIDHFEYKGIVNVFSSSSSSLALL